LRNQATQLPRGFKPSRLMLIAVAVVAGSLAAFLAVQREPPPAAPLAEPETVIEYVPEARTQILVAREPIAIGQRLTAASVGWVEWPESALIPEYMNIADAPEAAADIEGAVAKTDFVPGEPIRAQKLATEGQGYLSAMIAAGKRAVSVTVSAATASGGFVAPNDRVDVVLTRTSEVGHVSETILVNVRVLAIDHRTGASGPISDTPPEEPEVFGGTATATLELGPSESEIVINASTIGGLSLVLRPAATGETEPPARAMTANQAIRLTSPFWRN
jgi:pilus assembly protein CpaB